MPTGIYTRSKEQITKYKEAMRLKRSAGWTNACSWTNAHNRITVCSCGLPIEGHPQCDACGCPCEGQHLQSLTKYRDRLLCGHCWEDWKRLDELMKRQTTWEEFMLPPMNWLIPFLESRKLSKSNLLF